MIYSYKAHGAHVLNSSSNLSISSIEGRKELTNGKHGEIARVSWVEYCIIHIAETMVRPMKMASSNRHNVSWYEEKQIKKYKPVKAICHMQKKVM